MTKRTSGNLEKLYNELTQDRNLLRHQDLSTSEWLGRFCGALGFDPKLRERAEFYSGIITTDGHHSDNYDHAERQIVMLLGQARMGLDAKPSDKTEIQDFWIDMHPAVVTTSRSRYESEHYADAVEAALKELNHQIKQHVLSKGGDEKDGAKLMRYAFSMSSPIIKLERLQTESERNIQQGYMDLFAGAMIGIRNPKAHSNITLSAKRSRHMLHLASLLFEVFEERISEDES